MKEIIEKYKKGELRVKDCSHRIQFRDGDVIRNVYNDKSSGTKVEKCVTDNPAGINDCNTNLGYTNPNYFVATCAALDKEIAAMEKQPEYEYVPVELNEIGVWVDGSWCYASNLHFEWSKSNIVPINNVSAIHLIQNPHKLVQRVEITPEAKRDREIEELIPVLYDSCSVHLNPETLHSMAKRAIEWMESKK